MTQAPFGTLDAFRNLLRDLPEPDTQAQEAAEARNAQLTKPPGALGRLETLATWVGSWQGTEKPEIAAPQVAVFAGNHGVCAQGVSAFPPEVTVQMVANFEAGGAAINQLCRAMGARLSVHPLELERPTEDFTHAPAMSEADFLGALQVGWMAVDHDADLFVAGEMGIGNTTSAAALAHALYGETAGTWTGRGTGVDAEGLARKTDVVARGVALHAPQARDALDLLRRLGGRELAAMAGAIAAARTARIPVVLDGFICTAAAACLEDVRPGALDHCVAGHVSAEAGHVALLAKLGKPPLLSLDLRLGEGSGAATAIGILKAAVACQSGMATFAEAGVADG
ncbi:MAG: nicotinate-nucleotide--dimethylbenzimidazole phosphoribosyltransferase [Dinoroseobacter sp.]|nr:nicotinate-nucleotide--dimethylbenzimidazole phosphoribosyltransferase [Dinoroseobacter sp.]